jgi:hypothetical protein
MDCEKFEAALMDELYGELDELTSAAAKRHVTGCARCAALIGGFRATRRVAALPRVDPPEGLQQRILVAAAAASASQQPAPLGWRLARAVSLAGSWAMRPQTAMAAVFLVMIGTSVLLLRGKSSRAPASAEMTVTEEGTPAPAAASVAVVAPEPPVAPLRSALAVARSQERAPAALQPATDAPADDARLRGAAKSGAAKADGFSVAQNGASRAASAPAPPAGAGAAPAQRSFAVAPSPQADVALEAPGDPRAEISEARGARDSAAAEGRACPSGAQFDDVAHRTVGDPIEWDALFEGALCYESAGDVGGAKARLKELLAVDAYRDRARAQLDRIARSQPTRAGVPGAAGRASPKAAPATPASPPPSTESF